MHSSPSAPDRPPLHPLLGHLPAFRADTLDFLTHCARSYGPVVPLRMLHKPAFLLLDSADIERVLVTDHRNFMKPAWLRTAAVRRVLGDGLVTAEGDAWKQQRHACQPAFQPRRMEAYAAIIADLSQRRMEGWRAGETKNLQREMAELAMEVIARTLCDVDEADWSAEASAAVDALMKRFTGRRSLFGMIPLPASQTERKAARRLDASVDMLVRRQEERPEPGLLDTRQASMLSLLRNPGPGAGAGAATLHEQVKTFLAAGHESSALTLVWAFLALARSPEADAALSGELAAVLNGRAPCCADLAHLPFTRAVIQEVLRLYPPVWMTGRQALHGCEIGGYGVPRGAFIMTSQWAVQRMPGYFLRPDAFRPERWNNGETTDLPRFAYFPFGGGPRICIGQNFALVEAVLLLATIAQRFRLQPESGLDPRPWPSMTLRPPAGIQMRLVPRTP